MNADLYMGQKTNYVPSTEHMHERAQVDYGRTVTLTVPEGMAVEPAQWLLLSGFFGIALQQSPADEATEIELQIMPAQYETDAINDSDAFVLGTDMYWDPGAGEFVEADERWETGITYSDTPATMESNLESALDDLVGEDNYSISEETETYTIEFDVGVGETRLIADLDSLSVTGEVTLERTRDFNAADGEGEIWELDIGDATAGTFDLGIDCLWVGRVSDAKDDDDVVWFVLAPLNLQTTASEYTE